MIEYSEEKIFTVEQVQKLFLSVGWVSGVISCMFGFMIYVFVFILLICPLAAK